MICSKCGEMSLEVYHLSRSLKEMEVKYNSEKSISNAYAERLGECWKMIKKLKKKLKRLK